MYFNKFYFVLIILNFKYIIYININIDNFFLYFFPNLCYYFLFIYYQLNFL